MRGFLEHLFRRRRTASKLPLRLSLERQEEEAEIAKAQRAARREGDRFAESLIEKAGHRSYPYLKDPFE
jgi:hypothetical protein